MIGLEGDANGATFTGSTIDSSSSYLYQTRIPIDGSIRGRAGYAFDRVLLYATGGAAFAEIKSNVTEFSTGALDQDRPGRVVTLGAGVEYSIDNNWSVRAEYRYTDYGHYSYTLVNTTSDRTHSGFTRPTIAFRPASATSSIGSLCRRSPSLQNTDRSRARDLHPNARPAAQLPAVSLTPARNAIS